ncbi:phage tail protein, partial [Klebsiella pneumoniae]|nr:phage tail protein [Klebsiella pneumoniae]
NLPALSADKCHSLIVNGTQNEGYLDYTARLLLLDYRADSIQVLATVKNWLRQNHRHLDAAKKEVQLSFSSEIIDTDTFDLEIDFA